MRPAVANAITARHRQRVEHTRGAGKVAAWRHSLLLHNISTIAFLVKSSVMQCGCTFGSASAFVMREMLPGVEHRQHRYLNNRAENSHQPTRQRERRRQQCKSSGHPNASSPLMALALTISAHAGIGLPRPPLGKRYKQDSRPGRRSRLQPWPPKTVERQDPHSFDLDCSRANTLTAPAAGSPASPGSGKQ